MGIIKIDEDITKPLFAFAEDVERAEEQMDTNDDSYCRRNHIRAVFAMIEGTVYLLKQLALKGDSSAKLTMAERILIEEETFDLNENGTLKRRQKHVKLTTNVKFTQRCLEKVFGCTFNLNATPSGWDEFNAAIKIRK